MRLKRLPAQTLVLVAVLALLLMAACQPILPEGAEPAQVSKDDTAADLGMPPAPELTPDECQSLLASSNDFIRADDYAAVVELIDIVTACDITDDLKAGLLFMRAESNMQQGDWRAAVEDYRESLALGLESSDAAGARNNICWFLALDGQAEEALPYCEQAVEAQPSASYLDSRALVYAMTGNYAGAIDDFEAALDVWEESANPEIMAIYDERTEWVETLRTGENPITPGALANLQAEDAPSLHAELESAADPAATQHLLRGRRHHMYHQFNNAMNEYSLAIKLDPDYALAYFYRGLLNRWEGEWQASLDDMRQVLVLEPEQAFAHHIAGLMHMRLEEYDEAVTALSAAIELLPNELEFYADRAAANFSLGDPEAALDDMNMTLRFDPNSAEMLFMRGAAHRMLNNNGEAIADLELAIELGLPETLQEQAEQALRELRQGFF